MKAKKYYHIKLSHEHLQEAANISTGVFSPLKGFLTKTETKSVLDKKHLPGGMPWTIPIVLDIPQWIYQDIKRHKHITLIDGKDRIIAVMTVKDIYRYDKEEFAKRLKAMGLKVERLDGDIVRQSLTKDLGFSKEDRDRNIERVTFVAKLLSRNAVATLVSFVSPYREKRRKARQETTDFVEAYLKCPVEECQKRDTKGMYKKALAGEIENFTGVSDPYEEPENPEIILETDKEAPKESIDNVIEKLKELGLIPKKDEEKIRRKDKEKTKERLKSLGYM